MAQEEQPDENVRSTVSFKGSFHDEIKQRIRDGSFSSLSDYLRHAARVEMAQARREDLDAILLSLIDDQRYGPVTDDDFKVLRARIEEARARRRR